MVYVYELICKNFDIMLNLNCKKRVTLGNSSCPKEVQSFILKFFLRSAIHIIWNHYKIILLQWGSMLNIRISEENSKIF